MGSSEFIGELSHLSLTLMISYLGWWPNSINFEAWLEWRFIWRYFVAPVIVADHMALLVYPKMHIFFTGL